MKIRKTPADHAFNAVNYLIMTIVLIVTLYPFWYVTCGSVSSMAHLIKNGFILWPDGFHLDAYEQVFRNDLVPVAYRNTLIVTVGGTAVSMLLTILGAYALTRPGLMLKKPVMILIVITMYIGGGMIPDFMVVSKLGLFDSRWSVILATAITTYNLMVMRTAFLQVPHSLEESAMLDGANDFVILFRILLPVTKATIAVVALFYAVGRWNAWFNASIFLRSRTKYPLQLFLREILIANQTSGNDGVTAEDGVFYLEEVIKYCTIIVSTVPILCIYPFVQKYFVTGVMLGSVKG